MGHHVNDTIDQAAGNASQPDDLLSPAMSAEGQRGAAVAPDPIICISDLLWDEHWSSEQQLMSRLAKRSRILFVDRTISMLSFFTGSADASIGRQFMHFLRGGLRTEAENLTVLTLPPVLPFRFVKAINWLNEWMRTRVIRRALKKMNATAPVLWIYAPDAGRCVGQLGEKFSLYYCADDWSASEQWWNRSIDVRDREDELAAKVDLIIGTSSKIANKWQDRFGKALFISNGADVNSFRRARSPELMLPEDLKVIPEPRIGYTGFIDGRFDTQMYRQVVDRHPEWSFVVVGPLMEKSVDLAPLRGLSNVHFLGRRSREELVTYLKGFQVCVIPYVLNVWSESIFPLKLFEYLAAGCPVVASAMPELKRFQNCIRLADGPEEFEARIAESLAHPLPVVSDEFLAENSWDAKADKIWNLITDHLAKQGMNALRFESNFVTDADDFSESPKVRSENTSGI